ncbi:kynureninase [Parvicella tangerina]|uniref:Kynureninase n=1 Tax=Parvicella tangerina TaxID=2829795 RepID=A0A916NG82_9FLAO|nr:kynureninase [Parvicella tangerina]CAG5079316.1 Kynureninase [Parvicella tangerina]
MNYQNSLNFAQEKDKEDSLRSYREQFLFPTFTKKPVVYFTGNSLGLQPKSTREYINQELDDWAKWGVEGHFYAKNPWMPYHEILTKQTAEIVGAKPEEVVVTHSLTTNLHLLMVSFYRPHGKRYKILCEAKAFPSDQYALQSQVKFHGYEPNDALIQIALREGEHTVRMEDVKSLIDKHSEEIAMIMIGGVNYYTGQLWDMEAITQWGHSAGAIVGFDLAHAAGNIHLKLNEWGVDFAAWCGYKYLNSSPGGVSGLYVNERHLTNKDLPRFAGWWGQNKDTRFLMEEEFSPIPTAEAWQLSNAPVLGMAAHKASLDIFTSVGMEKLCEKRDALTGYLEFVIDDISDRYDNVDFEIITPRDKTQRGAQLSILAHGQGKELFDFISEEGVVADWREPNVIRIAPAPLYNNFEDVYRFGQILESYLKQ